MCFAYKMWQGRVLASVEIVFTSHPFVCEMPLVQGMLIGKLIDEKIKAIAGLK